MSFIFSYIFTRVVHQIHQPNKTDPIQLNTTTQVGFRGLVD